MVDFSKCRAKRTRKHSTVSSKEFTDFTLPFVLTWNHSCSRITWSVSLPSLVFFIYSRILLSWETRGEISCWKRAETCNVMVCGCSNFHFVNLCMPYKLCKCYIGSIKIVINIVETISYHAKRIAGHISPICFPVCDQISHLFTKAHICLFCGISPQQSEEAEHFPYYMNCNSFTFCFHASGSCLKQYTRSCPKFLTFRFYSAFQSCHEQPENINSEWTTSHAISVFPIWQLWKFSER